MKKTVVFGAGQIGRGFIGDICSRDGYELVFVDVVPEAVSLLNKRKSYPLWLLGREKTERIISDLKAVSLNDAGAVADELAGTDLAFTAVGANNVAGLGPALARGIEKRAAADPESFLNIIICENLLGSAQVLSEAVRRALPAELHGYLDRNVGFVEAVVSRMVAPLTPEIRAVDPLIVRVETYNILPVDKRAFKGPLPDIAALKFVDGLSRYEELKLFGHNLTHATLAYLGYRAGCTYIREAMENAEIAGRIDKIIAEVKPALMKKHNFPEAELDEYFSDLAERFRNKLLGDTVHRVGRDPLRKIGPQDRLIGSIALCLSQGIFPENICLVAAACLCYNYPADPDAVKLQAILKEKGVDFVLTEICRLKDSKVHELIKQIYLKWIPA